MSYIFSLDCLIVVFSLYNFFLITLIKKMMYFPRLIF